jgi:uncharacterized protein YbjT (DUF2867 family)
MKIIANTFANNTASTTRVISGAIRKIVVCLVGLVLLVPALADNTDSDDQIREASDDLVLVAGATGRTGRELVSVLLAKGYRVRAFVRNLDTARPKLGPDVEYAVGDVRQRETIDAALDGVTAMIVTIGASPYAPSNGPEFVDYGGVKTLAEAAADAKLRQYVLVSSAGVTQTDDHADFMNKSYDNILIWKYKGEQAVRKGSVPYTIVRPGGLTQGAGGETALRFLQGDEIQGKVTRVDVAQVCVAALSLVEAQGKTFELFGGDGPASTDFRGQFAAVEAD